MWECPTSAIPTEIWQAVEFFWLCHSRSPGFSGWTIVRHGLPVEGPIVAQDNWVIWSWQVVEHEFVKVQAEAQDESRRARELEQAHRKIQTENK